MKTPEQILTTLKSMQKDISDAEIKQALLTLANHVQAQEKAALATVEQINTAFAEMNERLNTHLQFLRHMDSLHTLQAQFNKQMFEAQKLLGQVAGGQRP